MLKWLLRPICWRKGHVWIVLREHPQAREAIANLHPMAAQDADCLRCGAEWRDAAGRERLYGGAVVERTAKEELETDPLVRRAVHYARTIANSTDPEADKIADGLAARASEGKAIRPLRRR